MPLARVGTDMAVWLVIGVLLWVLGIALVVAILYGYGEADAEYLTET